MASTEEQRPPATNGNGAADSDDDDPSKLRPVDIEADMREMERRKRVEAIMSSKLFREELERVVSDSLRDSGADGISHLLSDMMNVRQGQAVGAVGGSGVRGCSLPINDIRGLEGMSYTKHEKLLRCKLAAVYRLVDLYGWTQNIYNHITVSSTIMLYYFVGNRD